MKNILLKKLYACMTLFWGVNFARWKWHSVWSNYVIFSDLLWHGVLWKKYEILKHGWLFFVMKVFLQLFPLKILKGHLLYRGGSSRYVLRFLEVLIIKTSKVSAKKAMLLRISSWDLMLKLLNHSENLEMENIFIFRESLSWLSYYDKNVYFVA